MENLEISVILQWSFTGLENYNLKGNEHNLKKSVLNENFCSTKIFNGLDDTTC